MAKIGPFFVSHKTLDIIFKTVIMFTVSTGLYKPQTLCKNI
jgi:hypothetical protein